MIKLTIRGSISYSSVNERKEHQVTIEDPEIDDTELINVIKATSIERVLGIIGMDNIIKYAASNDVDLALDEGMRIINGQRKAAESWASKL